MKTILQIAEECGFGVMSPDVLEDWMDEFTAFATRIGVDQREIDAQICEVIIPDEYEVLDAIRNSLPPHR